MEITHEENIVMWLRTTYQSCDTQQITEAHRSLLNYMLADTSQSFSQLQKLLASTNLDIDYNCKKAMANLVRVSGREILKILREMLRESDTQKYKKIMFAAEHMFDNLKIASSLKLQIGEVYVGLFNFFTPDSNRLIGKCRYFFNIKEETQAMGLIQAYHHGQAPFKFRGAFYLAALETLLENLHKKLISLIKQTNGAILQIAEKDNQIIFKYLQITRQIWADEGFEKYESVFTNILGRPVLNEIIHIFSTHPWPGKLTAPLYDILAITASSLGRCNLLPKYNALVQQLESTGKKILAQYLLKPSNYSDSECLSELNFLTVVIEYKIVSCSLNCFSLFSQMIYPNYRCVQKYLSHNAENEEEIFNFLEDCSFQMESDCVPTKRNKLLAVMCRSSTECAASLRAIIYAFFYHHLPLISGGDVAKIPVNYCLKSGEELWASVNGKIDDVEQSKCMLLISALQVGLFMSDRSFLNYLEKFFESNYSFLLEKNPQIVFYTILIYRNYMDDIFGTAASTSFRIRFLRHILDPQQSIIKHFGVYVLKQHISREIPFEAVDYQVNQIMNYMSASFSQSILPLVVLIFKQYGAELKQEQAIAVVSKCFQLWVSKDSNLQCMGLQLLSNFFGIQSCKDHYDAFMETVLRVANEQFFLVQKYSDEFLGMLSKGLKTTGHLPENFQSVVMRLNLQIKTNQIMESLNSLIGYSRDQLFFNWLCQLITRPKLDIRSTLILHSLIYFGQRYLTVRNIRKIVAATYVARVMGDGHFNYHNGKLNLVFVLLFRFREDDISRLLIEEDWSDLREEVNRKRQLQNLLTKETWQGRSSFADQIYELVYKAENVYRWKYDIELFLVNQIWLLRHSLANNMQLRYANLSFVACLTNIIRAFEISRGPNEASDCESDDSLHRKTEVEKSKLAAKKILAHYSAPPEFTNANYLSQFKQLVQYLKKDEGGKKWVETLLQKLFEHSSKIQIYDQILKFQSIDGVFRKIRRLHPQSSRS